MHVWLGPAHFPQVDLGRVPAQHYPLCPLALRAISASRLTLAAVLLDTQLLPIGVHTDQSHWLHVAKAGQPLRSVTGERG